MVIRPSKPIFDDDRAYRRKEIRPKLGGVSDRALDVILAPLQRIALSKRTILYRGADLNALLDQRSA